MTREQFIYHVQATQKALRGFLVALCCGDSYRADDLAQDTLVKAYLAADTCRDNSRFKSWLMTIAYNTFISSNRAAGLDTVDVDHALHLSSGERADESFRYESLYRALSLIAPKERAAILLYYLEGYSVREISSMTDSGEAAVKQQLSRGRIHLREILETQNGNCDK